MSDQQHDAAVAAISALDPETDEHPSYEMLAGVVDATADEITREIVESHVAVCSSCAAELDDLRGFAGRPSHRVWWWSAAAAAALAGIAVAAFYAGEDNPARPTVVNVPRTIARPLPAPAASYARADWDRLVAGAVRTGRVEMPADLRAFASADAFRGGPDAASPVRLAPTATVIVETQPRFTWSGVSADDYQVRVYSNGRAVASSNRLRGNDWLCPITLERGETYRWQIVARRGDESVLVPLPPDPPAVFRILAASDYDELQLAARLHPTDDLLLGLLHARAGVLDRAHEHLARYASSTRSETARKLLDSLERKP